MTWSGQLSTLNRSHVVVLSVMFRSTRLKTSAFQLDMQATWRKLHENGVTFVGNASAMNAYEMVIINQRVKKMQEGRSSVIRYCPEVVLGEMAILEASRILLIIYKDRTFIMLSVLYFYNGRNFILI